MRDSVILPANSNLAPVSDKCIKSSSNKTEINIKLIINQMLFSEGGQFPQAAVR